VVSVDEHPQGGGVHERAVGVDDGRVGRAVHERGVGEGQARQLARQGTPNAHLDARGTERYCAPSADGERLLRHALAQLGLSARAYHRTLRIARTIADLAQAERASAAHVAEALQYRRFDPVAGRSG